MRARKGTDPSSFFTPPEILSATSFSGIEIPDARDREARAQTAKRSCYTFFLFLKFIAILFFLVSETTFFFTIALTMMIELGQ